MTFMPPPNSARPCRDISFRSAKPPRARSMPHSRTSCLLDGNSRQNLATFCQTWVEPEVRRLMDDCVDKNMIDKEEYPQTAEIESRCVHMLADLWNSPECRQDDRLLDDRLQRSRHAGGLGAQMEMAREAAGRRPIDRPAQPHHGSRCKSAGTSSPATSTSRSAKSRWSTDRLLLSPEEVVKRCDENTIGVVPTLGVTFTLQYEPVQQICPRSTRSKNGPASTFPSTSTRPAADSWPRLSIPSSSGISACRGSSRSTSPATSSAWPRWDADGSFGGRSTTCPRT